MCCSIFRQPLALTSACVPYPGRFFYYGRKNAIALYPISLISMAIKVASIELIGVIMEISSRIGVVEKERETCTKS
ncbi:hypothetical protein TCA2_2717 [Paenibacillus sp. TCA20]|nr:hypothetical protein TCA2_2717 [Paenibacillus sp. TCA20]